MASSAAQKRSKRRLIVATIWAQIADISPPLSPISPCGTLPAVADPQTLGEGTHPRRIRGALFLCGRPRWWRPLGGTQYCKLELHRTHRELVTCHRYFIVVHSDHPFRQLLLRACRHATGYTLCCGNSSSCL